MKTTRAVLGCALIVSLASCALLQESLRTEISYTSEEREALAAAPLELVSITVNHASQSAEIKAEAERLLAVLLSRRASTTRGEPWSMALILSETSFLRSTRFLRSISLQARLVPPNQGRPVYIYLAEDTEDSLASPAYLTRLFGSLLSAAQK